MISYRAYGRRDTLTKSSQFLEYIKLHRISLIQDNANLIQDTNSPDWNFLQGQIIATEHLLSVATDIMNSSNERVYE
jgi:hypothetical protein